ncbi:MAG: hypothetical protein LBK18_09945 [Prevotellaceae bacterium]|jgi:hypothetical protein|nr:hypothetical protein [Prevotellaceae bacterium]
MKHKVLILGGLLCLWSAASVFAAKAKPVAVASGSISVLKSPSKVFLEVDYSAAKVGEQALDEYLKGRGDDFVRDWPEDIKKTSASFALSFNRENRKGAQIPFPLMEDAGDAAYKLVIRIESIDMGNGSRFFNPFAPPKAGGIIISGAVDIVDTKTNEVVCTLKVNKVKGRGDVSESKRLSWMFGELAELICKLL